eukprot:RCo014600
MYCFLCASFSLRTPCFFFYRLSLPLFLGCLPLFPVAPLSWQHRSDHVVRPGRCFLPPSPLPLPPLLHSVRGVHVFSALFRARQKPVVQFRVSQPTAQTFIFATPSSVFGTESVVVALLFRKERQKK